MWCLSAVCMQAWWLRYIMPEHGIHLISRLHSAAHLTSSQHATAWGTHLFRFRCVFWFVLRVAAFAFDGPAAGSVRLKQKEVEQVAHAESLYRSRSGG